MSATNHTQNYDLSQFVGGDIPSWLNDYNGDMSKIDAAIASVAQGSGDVAADVASLKSRMTSAEADIDAAESNISTLQSTTSTQGAAITQNANNITTTNNNVSALDTRVTALENATALDFDLTAHEDEATITGETGITVGPYSTVKYQLNADKTIGRIFGGMTVSGVNCVAETTPVKVATINAGLNTRAAAADLNLGYATGSVSGTIAYFGVKLTFETDGTISVYVSRGSTTNGVVPINLPACLLFLNNI